MNKIQTVPRTARLMLTHWEIGNLFMSLYLTVLCRESMAAVNLKTRIRNVS